MSEVVAIGETSVPSTPSTRKRWFVLGTLIAVNLAMWLDELKFSALSAFWSESLSLNSAQTATILSSYYIGYAPMLFLAGVLADRFGPRLLLLVACVGVTVLSVSMAWVTTFSEMYIRNMIFGAFFGLVWAPSNRMIANWFPLHERTKATSYWIASANAAGIATPLIALPIANHTTWQTAFIVIAIICVPAFVALIKVTDRPVDTKAGAESVASSVEKEESLPLGELLYVLRNRNVWLVCMAGFCAASFSLPLAWVSYGLIKLDKIDPDVVATVSSLTFAVPFLFAFVNSPILSRVFRGRINLYMSTGLVFAGLCFGITAVVSVHWIVWAALTTSSMVVANTIFYGSLTAYSTQIVGARATGTVVGLATCLQILCSLVLIHHSGEWFDESVSGHHQLNLVFLVGAGLLFIGACLVMVAKRVTIDPDVKVVARTY